MLGAVLKEENMEYIFQIHWKLRKGLGPEWVDKVSEIGLDDLPPDTTYEEAKAMAISDFKSERYSRGTGDREYIITDVCGG